MEVLRNRGARKVPAEKINAPFLQSVRATRGHAAGQGGVHPLAPLAVATGARDLAAAVPLAPSGESDEDPFGFRDLGLDDAQAIPEHVNELVPCGPPGTRPQPGEKGAHPSHSLRRCAHVVWCQHCGRHAATWLGSGLIKAFPELLLAGILPASQH